MSRVSLCIFSLAAAAAFSLPAFGQAVISTRSGVVHFFEGTVSVAGQPLTAHFGKFTSIPEGAELRTEQGRAEILLTPGVFLRIGENSAVRMVDTALADTRVELLAGAAMVESADAAQGTAVTLLFRNWIVRQPHEGNYRIDSDPPRLQVRGGTVEVVAKGAEAGVTVTQGMDLPLEGVLAPEASKPAAPDSLNDWSDGRAQSISADNAISADIQDPATMSGPALGTDAFTYFPLLGYPSMPPTVSTTYTGLYGSMPIPSTVYQPGFSSLYLPGYTYRPSYLRLPITGLNGLSRTPYTPYSPMRLNPTGARPPVVGLPRPPAGRPITPPPPPHPTVHVGGH
jgi:hypothetical protein